jgi:hypothetical protein
VWVKGVLLHFAVWVAAGGTPSFGRTTGTKQTNFPFGSIPLLEVQPTLLLVASMPTNNPTHHLQSRAQKKTENEEFGCVLGVPSLFGWLVHFYSSCLECLLFSHPATATNFPRHIGATIIAAFETSTINSLIWFYHLEGYLAKAEDLCRQHQWGKGNTSWRCLLTGNVMGTLLVWWQCDVDTTIIICLFYNHPNP